MNKILLTLCFLAWSLNAHAVPGNISTSGSFDNGGQITISGTGFSVKPSAAPQIASYDNATASNNFHTGTIGGDWGYRDHAVIASDPTYQRTTLYQSDNYVQCEYISGYANVSYDATVSDYYYTSVWYYVTEDNFCPSIASGNSKFWRFYLDASPENSIYSMFQGNSADDGTPCEGFNEYGSQSAGLDANGGSLALDYGDTVFNMGSWQHHEIYFYIGSVANNTHLIEIINGKILRDWDEDGRSLFEGGATASLMRFRFGEVSGINSIGGYIQVSDIYIDSTRAHVFISDASSWVSSWTAATVTTHSEVQIPSVWTDTEITITVNQGSFANSSEQYLYIVDINGDVNTIGYPITFGAGEESTYKSIGTQPLRH